MPNRYKREGWLRSRKLALASADAERLVGRIMLAVDDFGRMDADPALVRSQCFPRSYDRFTDAQVAGWLDELDCCLHMILRYKVGQDWILLLLNTDAPRAQSSKYPPPPASLQEKIRAWSQEGPPATCPHRSGSIAEPSADAGEHVLADADALQASANTCQHMSTHAPDLRSRSTVTIPVTVTEKEKPPAPDGASAFDADFDEFWNRRDRPPNDSRKPALLKYRAARRRGASREELLEAMAYEAELRAEAQATGEFFPAAAHTKTWLGQEKWRDLLALKRDRGAAAARAAADRERQASQSHTARLEFMSEMRRRAPALYQQRVRNLMADERTAIEAELDEFDRNHGAASPSGQQAAGGQA